VSAPDVAIVGGGIVHVAAGHGPWGISIGPATAALAAEAILGRRAIPSELAAGRLGAPSG
jgi:glycine/D-amino acid oxidase-like deaminating enzyme